MQMLTRNSNEENRTNYKSDLNSITSTNATKNSLLECCFPWIVFTPVGLLFSRLYSDLSDGCRGSAKTAKSSRHIWTFLVWTGGKFEWKRRTMRRIVCLFVWWTGKRQPGEGNCGDSFRMHNSSAVEDETEIKSIEGFLNHNFSALSPNASALNFFLHFPTPFLCSVSIFVQAI